MGDDRGDDEHADTHADGSGDEQELAAKAIDGPSGVESEQNTECSVEGVNESNGRGVGEDLLVDNGRVGVEGTLAGDLLTGVEDKGEQQTLAHGAILPEGRVGRGDGFLFELESFTDLEDFVLDFFFGVADLSETGAGLLDSAATLYVPTGSLWDEPDLGNNEDRHEDLEYDDHLPVPLAEGLDVLCASIVDPVATFPSARSVKIVVVQSDLRNETSDTVESLPEGHDLSSNL